MAFYISSTLFEHLQHSRATGDGEDVSTAIGPFSDCFADALNVVEAIKQVAGYKYALLYVADTVPVAASAAAVWMVKVLANAFPADVTTTDGDVEGFWSWFENGQELPASGMPFTLLAVLMYTAYGTWSAIQFSHYSKLP
ncbi:MAG: hypothetical protein CYPHOPRED_004520, partial [Cyphobasidiales sp. Tagirdzhanova-0007]